MPTQQRSTNKRRNNANNGTTTNAPPVPVSPQARAAAQAAQRSQSNASGNTTAARGNGPRTRVGRNRSLSLVYDNEVATYRVESVSGTGAGGATGHEGNARAGRSLTETFVAGELGSPLDRGDARRVAASGSTSGPDVFPASDQSLVPGAAAHDALEPIGLGRVDSQTSDAYQDRQLDLGRRPESRLAALVTSRTELEAWTDDPTWPASLSLDMRALVRGELAFRLTREADMFRAACEQVVDRLKGLAAGREKAATFFAGIVAQLVLPGIGSALMALPTLAGLAEKTPRLIKAAADTVKKGAATAMGGYVKELAQVGEKEKFLTALADSYAAGLEPLAGNIAVADDEALLWLHASRAGRTTAGMRKQVAAILARHESIQAAAAGEVIRSNPDARTYTQRLLVRIGTRLAVVRGDFHQHRAHGYYFEFWVDHGEVPASVTVTKSLRAEEVHGSD